MLSAKQAAEATGVSKQAIIRAIKRGTLSASKDIHGEWTIDAAELFRVYQPVPTVHTNGNGNEGVHDADVHTPDTPSVEALQEKLAMMERLIDAKDDVITAKDDTIGDLRARLNVEQEERRRLTMMLTATSTPAPVQEVKKKGFWQRLFGGGE